jgi:sulfatase modifying factor 1
MGHDVFVSHSSKDKLIADALVAHLERSGIRCWVAPRDILPGASWAGSILKAISDAKLMVLVFSGHTNDSPHIRREVERAVHHRIPVAPVRIAAVQPTDDMEYFLGASHWMDAITPPIEAHFAKLAGTIKLLLNLPAEAPAMAAPPVMPPAVEHPPVAAPSVPGPKVVAPPTAPPPVALAPALSPPFARLVPAASSKHRWPWLLAVAAVVTLVVVGLLLLKRDSASRIVDSRSASPVAPATAPAASVAAETPEQQQEHLAKEEEAKAEAARQARVEGFLGIARANDDEDHDTVALAALDELLKLDPENPVAVQLRDKISKYAPMKRERLAKEAAKQAAEAAAARQAKIDSLLDTARANDSEDRDTVALTALDDVLKLDPENPAAMQLREKISQYAPMKRERLAQEAAADRQAKVDSLLATAMADDNKDHGLDGLAALDELLKLDPQNAAALSLREKINSDLRPTKIGDTWTNTLGMTFAYIPAGTFVMGSPVNEKGRDLIPENERQHTVILTREFLMGTTHVTVDQFAAFVKDSGYQTDEEKSIANDPEHRPGFSWRVPPPDWVQGGDYPVVYLTWNDATAFCDWLSRKEGKRYRLPTEAEWEYAARAGTRTAYLWGDNPDDGKGWANCADQAWKEAVGDTAGEQPFSWSDGYIYTSPVGKFRANAWGLRDMIGNAKQWCNDYFARYPEADARDPKGPTAAIAKEYLGTGELDRAARGASYCDPPSASRCASRQGLKPNEIGAGDVGFRLVLDSE